MKRTLPMLLAILLAICSAGYPLLAEPELPDVTGTNISSFSARTLDGSALDGSVFEEHGLTLLHFFAAWSSDCIEEMLYLQHAVEAFNGSIAVIGILYEDAVSTPEAALALMEQYGISYACVLPDRVLKSLVSHYNIIPQTFFVSQDGMVLEHFPGNYSSYGQLEREIDYWLEHAVNSYTVEFKDQLTGLTLAVRTVFSGDDAQPPAPPVHPGFEFMGWRGNYLNIHAPAVIYASYLQTDKDFLRGDVDIDGRITTLDALLSARHAMGLLFSPSAVMFGDMNLDGQTSMIDSLIILRTVILGHVF